MHLTAQSLKTPPLAASRVYAHYRSQGDGHITVDSDEDAKTALEAITTLGLDAHLGSPQPGKVTISVRQPAKLALLGLGTVGTGVLERALMEPDLYTIAAIAVRSPDKHKPTLDRLDLPHSLLTTADQLAGNNYDILVEVAGGLDTAHDAITAALNNKSEVVTANKALIAERGPELRERAHKQGVSLRYAAAVAGGIPALEFIERESKAAHEHGGIYSIRGVVNGTTNYLLTELAAGASFKDTIAKAIDLGYAEAEYHFDTDGIDAAQKLAIMVHTATNAVGQPFDINWKDIKRDPLNAENAPDITARPGITRQVAMFLVEHSKPTVELAPLEPTDPLYDLPGPWNGVEIRFNDGTSRSIKGVGAGRYPTAASVFADIENAAVDRSLRG